MVILRKSLWTPLTKLLISLGITSCHLAVLNVLFMLDFLGLDLLTSWFADKVSSTVTLYYNAAIVSTIFTACAAFFSIYKDVLSIFQQNNLIYKFQCRCNATYIGRTSQCLQVRVKQHFPRDIRNHTTSRHSIVLHSAICEHSNALNSYVVNYSDECFVVLHRARTKQHLIVLEAIQIFFNRPSFGKQNPKHSLNLLGDILT